MSAPPPNRTAPDWFTLAGTATMWASPCRCPQGFALAGTTVMAWWRLQMYPPLASEKLRRTLSARIAAVEPADSPYLLPARRHLRGILARMPHNTSRLRDECLNIEEFVNLLEARVVITDQQSQYNTYRPHQSLGGLTPSAYATHSEAQQHQLTTSLVVSRILYTRA